MSEVGSTGVPDAAHPTLLGPGAPVLAFDVGGTDMKAALVDDSGALIDVRRVPTPLAGEHTADAVLAEIANLARDLALLHPRIVPEAAALLVPGHVDDIAGVGVFAENLGWHDAPFRARLSALLGVPAGFGHDVRGAGEAEYRLGAAAPFRDVIVVTIGTGIAAAVFLDGRLHTGGGMAGEIGHARVADGPACVCGGRGCLEAIASAGAIARRYSALTGVAVTGAKDVLARASAGDPAAETIWQSALDALALSLSQVTALLAPEAIVIGGGLAQAGDALFEPLRRRVDSILTIHRRPLIIPASIGENAGLIGAALRARDALAS